MSEQKLDITGVVCPFCLIKVKEAFDQVSAGGILKVICDHPPAAKDTIPAYAEMKGWKCSVREVESGLWELTLSK
ncbi:MAG TPA: sulfurtransferase TusA family protein [Methanospirillum sp.]|uniref:sulfurtransferase TusA family protein n=1 Tax=Methanospirillum sp. TaxID=45200 RepID=UPI002B6EEBA4|nr:sulfurtransferase TusA family protein [Methanospirillum sp.]HWQ63089.1 sulfurtransferase TusA family protein [Methanospirillum sp.]